MVRYAFIAMAGLAAGLPLNINLGAYSPALVVGDGEISFGGEQDVSSLMNVLEGAAVNTAASVANNANAANNAAAAANNAATKATPTPTPTTTSTAAAAASSTTQAIAAAAAAADPGLAAQAAQIAKLQGMGKEIAPRAAVVDVHTQIIDVEEEDVEEEDVQETPAKRDLSGFDRALTFAEAALTKGPKIELGTGEGGSGVGITVDNGASTTAAKAKRDQSAAAAADAPAPRRRAKVTTMYVRSGIPAALQSKRDSAAGDVKRSAPFSPARPAVPVGRRDVLDALNLNVDGDQGLTMTFVEELEE